MWPDITFWIVLLVAVASLALGLIVFVIFRKPRADRDWLPVFDRVTTFGEHEGNKILIRNLRDWEFGERGPVQKNWRSALVDPSSVKSVLYYVDLLPRSKAFAHAFAGFEVIGEKGVEYLTLSVEVRKTVGQRYSPVRGVFNAYELIYVWSTERDALCLRAVAHGKHVYGYKVNLAADQAEKVFRAFATETNKLAEKPKFYNTLTSNCTSLLARAVNQIGKTRIPLHYSYILTGFSDKYLHRLGFIGDRKQGFAATRAEAYLTEKVRSVAASDAVNFSARLRSMATF